MLFKVIRTGMLVPFVLALAVGSSAESVLAHASLQESTPPRNGVVTEAPEQVLLEYSMAVEPNFSTFKVYPVPAQDSEVELRAAASRVVGEVLTLRDDEDARIDLGIQNVQGRSAEISLLLPEELEPGAYVVMWRVLAIDTHITEGFFIFTYEAPEPEPADEG